MPKIDHTLLCHFTKIAFTVIMKGFVSIFLNVSFNKNLQIRQFLRENSNALFGLTQQYNENSRNLLHNISDSDLNLN